MGFLSAIASPRRKRNLRASPSLCLDTCHRHDKEARRWLQALHYKQKNSIFSYMISTKPDLKEGHNGSNTLNQLAWLSSSLRSGKKTVSYNDQGRSNQLLVAVKLTVVIQQSQRRHQTNDPSITRSRPLSADLALSREILHRKTSQIGDSRRFVSAKFGLQRPFEEQTESIGAIAAG